VKLSPNQPRRAQRVAKNFGFFPQAEKTCHEFHEFHENGGKVRQMNTESVFICGFKISGRAA